MNKGMQRRQAIMSGIVSSCWNSWVGLAVYNTLKHTTKLEKVEIHNSTTVQSTLSTT